MSNTLLTPTATPPAPETPPVVDPGAPIITPPADRDWTQAVKPDGSFDAKAHEYGIPEHMKSIGGMWESYQNLQRMKGAPGAEASPEQLKAYREANGIPEVVNAEAYGLKLPDELKDVYAPESLDRIVKAANESAHLGHTEMMKAVVSEFGAMEIEGMGKQAEANEAAQAAQLAEKAKMLEADPNFSGENKGAALQTSANALNSALGELGVDPNSEEAMDVARSPLMVRILHHFGSKTSQDSTNLGSPVSDLRSQEEQANDIMTNPNNPEYKLYQEGDARVGKKVLALMGAK